MLDWLKRFGLSLFSDKYAKESVKNGFGTVLLTSLLAIAFVFAGIFAAQTLSFVPYYNDADEFRQFVDNAFNNGLSVEIKDSKAVITQNGAPVVIDTSANEADRDKYFINGYQLFVDFRNVISVYDDFHAYGKSVKDGSEISYDEYLLLSGSAENDYVFAVKYSGVQKVITENDVETYKTYLLGVNDSDIREQYKSLQNSVGNMTKADYENKLYALYVRAYYPNMSAVVGEQIPTLYGYYYQAAAKSDGKYLCLFQDTAVASFKSRGNTISFGGIYKEGNGFSVNGNRNCDEFIKSLYKDSVPTLFLVELMDCVLLIAIAELIIVAVMLTAFVICKVKKIELFYTFGKSVKLVASYSHAAALLGALFTIIMGFVVSGQILRIVAYVSFAVTLVIRTVILLIKENKTGEKHIDTEDAAEEAAE